MPPRRTLRSPSHAVPVTLRLGTPRDLSKASTILFPATKAALTARTLKGALAADTTAQLSHLIRERKLANTSAPLSVLLARPAGARGARSAVQVTLLPTDYSTRNDLFERLASLRKLGSQIAEHARKIGGAQTFVDATHLTLATGDEQHALLEGITLSLYSFERYRSKPAKSALKSITFVSSQFSQKTLTRARIVGEAVFLARDLVNTPSRDCTPSSVRALAQQLARRAKLRFKAYDRSALERLGADLMLSVFRSSNERPYLLTLRYTPRAAKYRVALVGKGVTFDSGGLSIKSGPGMYDMKSDMAGAAAVLATICAAAALKLNVEVLAYLPTTENMINRESTHPGDVVHALNGKTVEILNTDAEGRLILGDTLVLAERDKPDVIIDLATLTGAIITALGSDYAGVFSTSDQLSSALVDAGTRAGERLWRFPLSPEYRERIKSPVADLKNIGGSEAGSIIAALFLSEFVEKTPWAHLDIAGPAFLASDRAAIPKGGSGYGVRTLINYLQKLSDSAR